MSTRPNRLILAATLALVLGIAGILAWQLTPARDPILGTWTRPGTKLVYFPYHFHADHRFTQFNRTGTWKLLPGPYYERTGGVLNIDNDFPTFVYNRFLSPAQLTPGQLQIAEASGALRRIPASAQIRLYECQFIPIPPKTSPTEPFIITLSGGELQSELSMGITYKRPAHWLNHAWNRLRSLLN